MNTTNRPLPSGLLAALLLVIMVGPVEAQVPFWRSSSGPFGGTITSLFKHPSGRIFAGVNSVGAYVSDDHGRSWTSFNTNLLSYYPVCFIAPSSDSVIAATDMGISISPASSDAWRYLYRNVSSNLPVNVVARASNGDLYGGTSIQGLVKSTDGGVTWTTLAGGAPSTNTVALLPTSSTTVYAGTWGNGPQDGIFRSVNAGASWTKLNDPNQFKAVRVIVQKGSSLLVATSGGVFRSTNDGSSWTLSTPGNSGTITNALIVTADGSLLAGTDGGKVFRSTNDGTSWTEHSSGLPSQSVRALTVADDGSWLAGVDERSVYRSTDQGATWTQSHRGMTVREITAILVTGGEELFVATTESGVFRSSDDGSSWSITGGATSTRFATGLIKLPDGTLVLATGTGMLKSTDNGASWIPGSISQEGVLSLIRIANGDVYATTHNGVWRSTDDTYGWTVHPLPDWPRTIAANTAGKIIAGTSAGLYRSLDTGATWQKVWESQVNSWVNSTAIAPDGRMYAGTQDGFQRSTDDGATWTKMDPAKFWLPVTAIGWNREGHVFAGLYRAIYRSTDGGDSWTLLDNVELTSYPICFAVDTEGYIYVGTARDGVFRSNSTTTTVRSDRTEVPFGFELGQNYPNPFNPSTAIPFGLPHRSHVRLELFDLLGQRVMTLVEGEYDAGTHTVTASVPLASGVYVYRLTAASIDTPAGRTVVLSRKLAMLR